MFQRLTAAVTIAIFLAACPEGVPRTQETCASAGALCRYEGNQLGVCLMADGAYICTPQH